METKFTPGPWRMAGDYIFSFSLKKLDKGGNPRPICGPAIVPGETEENIANASLISAAPELYEMLNESLFGVDVDWDTFLPKAQAVLAKARGKP